MDKRFKTADERLSRYVVGDGDCWNWTGAKLWNGYGRLAPLDGEYLAHRASFAHHNGRIPDGAIILHSCDNRSCINPAHLRVGDRSENNLDAYARGRRPDLSGERNANAKLTAAQADAIRSDSRTQAAIAQKYGVSTSLVSAIKNNTAWRTANATKRAQMNLR